MWSWCCSCPFNLYSCTESVQLYCRALTTATNRMPHHTPLPLSSSILLVLSLRAACAANSPGGWPPKDSNGAHHFSALGLFGKSGGNLQPVIGTVSKYHKNPLFNQDKPWEPRLDNGYPNIVYDSQSQGDGPWRLWYGGIGGQCTLDCHS